MSVVAGDTLEVRYNHPTLGSGAFYPKANESFTFSPGGFRSDDDDNMIDGSGEMIDKMNQERWSLEGPFSNDQNTREDHERAIALAGDPVQADWTVTYQNNTVWAAKGKPVGKLNADTNAGTFSMKLAGGGKMKKIVG